MSVPTRPEDPTRAPAADRSAGREDLRARAALLATAPPDEVRAWIEECEEGGMVGEAVRGCQILLERDPRDAPTWRRLAALHRERGDARLAAECLRRGAAIDGGPGPDVLTGGAASLAFPPPPDAPAIRFEEADVTRFLHLFAGREDVHARQWYDPERGQGGYSPVREPLSEALVRVHLEGRLTLGSYVLRSDGAARFAVVDLDARGDALARTAGDGEAVAALRSRVEAAARSLAGTLAQLGLPFLLEDSGHKGRHLWIFLTRPVQAATVRAFGAALRRAARPGEPDVSMEFFPKQDRLEPGGLGNLVKLPLGIHRVSGRRAWILRQDGTAHPNPAVALRELETVSADRLSEATATLLARRPAGPDDGGPEGEPGDTPVRRTRIAPPAPPPWTEADYGVDPQIAPLLAGCAVLRRLVARGLAGDAMGQDEAMVLKHTIGHTREGPRAFNYVFRHLPEIPEPWRLVRRLRGSPMSCLRIRQRVPGVADRVGCDCDFGPVLLTYATPLLHARDGEGPVRLVDTSEVAASAPRGPGSVGEEA
ncbi:CRISPR-associated primase-polymerase type A1 [Myxococcota bacterium]|nr:CRISPR-associated primase-polymerase type A1 [Myxococcota bacterium]